MTTVPFAYLTEQFAEAEAAEIFAEIAKVVKTGDFTLGSVVGAFEAQFAGWLGCRHAIGVNSGTDALKLSLWGLGVGPGDEVITVANTFIATVGAINEMRARPVLIDCDDSLCMDVNQLEAAITPRTRAIIPVHLSGDMADMPRVLEIAGRHGVPVVEDACQAIGSTLDGRFAGTFGKTGAFSLHPMKFLNIWGDGGVIATDDDEMATKLRLLRNHGLISRDAITFFGCNSRLDSVQAVVAAHVLKRADWILERRAANAAFYDANLAGLPGLRKPARLPRVRHSWVTYQLFAEERDALLKHCQAAGVDCKVHYPIPLYQQEGLRGLGYAPGDFPVADRQAATTISLPVHQYLTPGHLEAVVATIRSFYA